MKTLKLKLRSGNEPWLNAAAMETNLVWNYCNEISAKAAHPYAGKPRRLSYFDLSYLLTGTHKELSFLSANCVLQIARGYATSRIASRKTRLNWRKSIGSKRSLGWIPFRGRQARFIGGTIVFADRRFRVFDSYGLANYAFVSGSFSQNALGDWFINLVVDDGRAADSELPSSAVGIDLGLKDIAVTSDFRALGAGRWTRAIEPRLAMAQRRGHKRQAKRLHRKATNRRSDALHKFSRVMVEEYGAIYIGDVSSVKLVRTRMAKSVLDSGWGMLKTMLLYKGHRAGRIVEIVDEKFTTQACSSCGAITGPKGRTGLVVRVWTCTECDAVHSRDVNAARNILARGLSGPSAGTGVL